MLRDEDAIRCLHIVNGAVRDAAPRSQLGVGEFLDLFNRGAFGARATLKAEELLVAIFQRALERVLPPVEPLPEPLTLIPSSPQCYQTNQYRIGEIRNPEFELLYEQNSLPFVNEIYGSTFLTVRPLQRGVTFTGWELFYEFLALDLHYTLRDGRFRFLRHATKEENKAQEQRWREKMNQITSVRPPTEAEMAAWMNSKPPSLAEECQRLERQRIVTFYPSRQDQKKIVVFLNKYGGPSFLPDDKSDPRTGELFVDRPLEYLGAFNSAWQTFDEVARLLLSPPITPGLSREDRVRLGRDPVDRALDTINDILEQGRLALFRQEDGTIGARVEQMCGLHWCYVVLYEQLIDHQPSSRCELSTCQLPFNPRRKDQTCCCTTHANRLRQRRYNRKSHR